MERESSVTVNNGLLRNFAIEAHGIDQKMICRRSQLLNRVQHGEA